MKGKNSIKKFFTLLLVVLFTISFIPKSHFHDVIATHTDDKGCEHPAQNLGCLHQKGFNCSFNDLVVTTPYISLIIKFNFNEVRFLSSSVSNYYCFLFKHYFFNTESRGPPAAAV